MPNKCPSKPSSASYQKLLRLLNRKGALHASLIDPDPRRQSPAEAAEMAAIADRLGSDVILVGGSTCVDQEAIRQTLVAIRARTAKPLFIFPGSAAYPFQEAEAVLFISLLNAGNPYFFSGQQAIGAMALKQSGVEAIGTAYLIVDPGGTAGWLADARPLPRHKPELAAAYALAAQYMGFKLVYLEAGSGAEQAVPCSLIKVVKSMLDIPLIVGGGIVCADSAAMTVKAGADIIVQGSFLEQSLPRDGGKALKVIIDAIHAAGSHLIDSPQTAAQSCQNPS